MELHMYEINTLSVKLFVKGLQVLTLWDLDFIKYQIAPNVETYQSVNLKGNPKKCFQIKPTHVVFLEKMQIANNNNHW